MNETMIKLLLLSLSLLGLNCVANGCGPNPMMPPTPENRLTIRKGITGTTIGVWNMTNTNATLRLKGLHYAKGAEFDLDELQADFKSAQSENQQEQVSIMREYTGQLVEAYRGKVALTEAAFSGVSGIVEQVSPLVGLFLQGRIEKARLSATRPSILQELSQLIATGRAPAGEVVAAVNRVDPDMANLLIAGSPLPSTATQPAQPTQVP